MRLFAGTVVALALTVAAAAPAQPAATSSKAQDAAAVANLRKLVSLISACYAKADDYTQCTMARQLTRGGKVKTSVPIVDGKPKARSGTVSVTESSATEFWAMAVSQSGDRFELRVAADGRVKQLCAPRGHGGCPASGHFDSGALSLIANQRRRHHTLMASYDASARAAVAAVARYVDACGSATKTYEKCDSTPELVPYGAPATLSLAEGFPYQPGQVAVTSTPTSYILQIVSRGGPQYVLSHNPDGGVNRTCTPAGTASCSGAGTW